MKITHTDYDGSTIYHIRRNNGKVLYVFGTLEEFERAHIMSHEGRMPGEIWVLFDNNQPGRPMFFDTKDLLIAYVREVEEAA